MANEKVKSLPPYFCQCQKETTLFLIMHMPKHSAVVVKKAGAGVAIVCLLSKGNRGENNMPFFKLLLRKDTCFTK